MTQYETQRSNFLIPSVLLAKLSSQTAAAYKYKLNEEHLGPSYIYDREQASS